MPTILLVEDDPIMADLLTDVLTDAGYTVRDAANGIVALAQLALVPIDLVLSDVLMPEMDGITLCEVIQANPHYKHIPVVLMSAHSTFVPMAHCAPKAMIRKPLDLNNLLSTIAQHLP